MNLHPSLVSTLLQSRSLPLDKSVTSGVEGLGSAILPTTAVRMLDIGSGRNTYVFIPEPPNTIEHYRELAATLSTKSRVIVYDVPGFGFSYPKFGFDYSIAHQADALIALLHRLKVRQATICAPGFMAYAALTVAKREPILVQRLILPQAPAHREMLGWITRMDLKEVLVKPWIGQVAAFLGKGHMFKYWYRSVQPEGENLDRWTDHASWTLGKGAAFCLASTFQQLPRANPSAFEGTDVEVVALWGASDRSYEGVDADTILEHAPGARVEIVKEAGHFQDLESPERLIALLEG